MQIKSKFRSRSEHALDAKGRLSFPSRFKDVLRYYDSELLMATAWGKTHLRIYPASEWEILETKLMSQGNEQPGMARLVRLIISGVTECTLDKQGRILLPAYLRNEVGLEKDIIMTGMLDWVEVWSKDNWNAEHQATQENFEDFEEKLANIGIF